MTNLTIAEINTAIIAGNFTNDQLNSIGDAIKFARAQIANQNKFTLVKGSQVKFTSSKSGQTVLGTVEKVNRKFIIVRETGKAFSTWRVPANMLQAA
jgi:exosome complex RNA-binding protein Csl4